MCGGTHGIQLPDSDLDRQGSIPACAGEPSYPMAHRNIVRAYVGLSPRVRGNLAQVMASNRIARHQARSIPACAGEPDTTACSVPGHSERSIPACAGEPARVMRTLASSYRSIPACAGEPSCCDLLPLLPLCGSIPACAGEPSPRSPFISVTRIWVYPRVCGGTGHSASGHLDDAGSIPACAGEPAGHGAGLHRKIHQLSPRVRGNLHTDTSCLPGSIPACAGEPSLPPGKSRGRYRSKRSIPACAGEPPCRYAGHRFDDLGLSPRVRGNLSV